MASPSRFELHIDRPLTNFSTATIQDENNYVASKIFPTLSVQQQSNLFARYLKDYWFRSGAMLRAPATESVGGQFKITYGQYLCRKWAIHYDVSEEQRANQDDAFDIDRDATRFCVNNLLIRKEKLFVNAFMKTGVWTGLSQTVSNVTTAYDFAPSVNGVGSGGTAGTFGYNNGFWGLSTSAPIVDVTNLKLAALSQTGQTMNTLVVTPDVDAALRNNVSLIERIKYSGSPGQPAIISDAAIAQVFGVDNYYVVKAIQNSAQEGLPGVYNFMATNAALLCYTPSSPSLMQPASGYTFAWTGLLGAGAAASRVAKIPMPHLRADRIEAEMAFDMQLVGPDMGIYMTHVLS